jgi:hypothetical protein
MHGPINVKSPNNMSKWQMGFNSAFKGLIQYSGGKSGGAVTPTFQRSVLLSVSPNITMNVINVTSTRYINVSHKAAT